MSKSQFTGISFKKIRFLSRLAFSDIFESSRIETDRFGQFDSYKNLSDNHRDFILDWINFWYSDFSGCGQKLRGFKIFLHFLSWFCHGCTMGDLGRWKAGEGSLTWNSNIIYETNWYSSYINVNKHFLVTIILIAVPDNNQCNRLT